MLRLINLKQKKSRRVRQWKQQTRNQLSLSLMETKRKQLRQLHKRMSRRPQLKRRLSLRQYHKSLPPSLPLRLQHPWQSRVWTWSHLRQQAHNRRKWRALSRRVLSNLLPIRMQLLKRSSINLNKSLKKSNIRKSSINPHKRLKVSLSFKNKLQLLSKKKLWLHRLFSEKLSMKKNMFRMLNSKLNDYFHN